MCTYYVHTNISSLGSLGSLSHTEIVLSQIDGYWSDNNKKKLQLKSILQPKQVRLNARQKEIEKIAKKYAKNNQWLRQPKRWPKRKFQRKKQTNQIHIVRWLLDCMFFSLDFALIYSIFRSQCSIQIFIRILISHAHSTTKHINSCGIQSRKIELHCLDLVASWW